jgi:hypothetical protein
VQSTAGIIVCQLLGVFNEEVARLHMNQQWRHPVGMEQRRALQLLASVPFGTTDTI